MSKRRNANGQMRREDYEAQERADDDPRAFNPELQAGTFQRASAEKLKTRRIVKARRPAQMAPVAEAPTSSNPFANVSLAAPASTNPFANVALAAPPAAANPFANITLAPPPAAANPFANIALTAPAAPAAAADDAKEETAPAPAAEAPAKAASPEKEAASPAE